MGEDPAASWLTYLIIGLGFILGASIALVVKMGREDDDLEMTEQMFDEKEHVDFEANLPPSQEDNMIPLDQLPPVPIETTDYSDDGGEVND